MYSVYIICFITELGLWCLTSLSTISQLYCGGSFYWWSKQGVPLENMARRDHILLYKNIPINMSAYDDIFKYEYICNVLSFLPPNTLCPLHLNLDARNLSHSLILNML